jgi:hypothetical protein
MVVFSVQCEMNTRLSGNGKNEPELSLNPLYRFGHLCCRTPLQPKGCSAHERMRFQVAPA